MILYRASFTLSLSLSISHLSLSTCAVLNSLFLVHFRVQYLRTPLIHFDNIFPSSRPPPTGNASHCPANLVYIISISLFLSFSLSTCPTILLRLYIISLLPRYNPSQGINSIFVVSFKRKTQPFLYRMDTDHNRTEPKSGQQNARPH